MSAQVRRLEDAHELRAQRLRGERVKRPEGGSEPYLSKQGAADHFDVSKATVDYWCRKGMPFHQLGARRRFRVSEIEAWLRDR